MRKGSTLHRREQATELLSDCVFRVRDRENWLHPHSNESSEEIGEQCLGIDPTLKGLIDRAVPLTEYAWKFRYLAAEPVPKVLVPVTGFLL